ncbi:hypothetical protein KL930_005222 [Ogataea haglerorum]|uniref:Uncharacterized protein n=1 Tax=Ogataea haglerorum TaxID=1937702 RepID=A0AAN6D0V9_9ASCO|nr:uncharacterized protein KL911_005233 [Ogataea haglerorum]KAG7691990.1 hypothetical protein KL951_005194 [Ogataea haglerorum]KAG7702343.1 hypothetical protein KL914_005272 [Ogataea haglerorum]KAG7702431.1 hypothetical protein KL950_005246 [Ogataea haglerorum]KAG7713224.1 hypothetical protein KL913_005205 [Ogataea haglerorum]KAG7713495.1 hypothetical protein KL949_005244 [Ogataea haglerorum]
MRAINLSLAVAGPYKETVKRNVEVDTATMPEIGVWNGHPRPLGRTSVLADGNWVYSYREDLVGAIDMKSEITQLITHHDYIYVLCEAKLVVFSQNTLELVDEAVLEYVGDRFWLLDIDQNVVIVVQSRSIITVVTHCNTLTTSSPLYLPFWAKGVVLLSRFYVYVVGPSGQYEVFRYNLQRKAFLAADRKMLIRIGAFGAQKHGRIIDIVCAGPGKWAVLQERGWALYEVRNAQLFEVASSSLAVPGERLATMDLEDGFVIHLQNGELLVVNGDVRQLETMAKPEKLKNPAFSAIDDINSYVLESRDDYLAFHSAYTTFYRCSLPLANFPVEVFFRLSVDMDRLAELFLSYAVENYSFLLLSRLCLYCVSGNRTAFFLLDQLLAGVGRFNEELVGTWRNYLEETYFPSSENYSVYAVLVLGLLFCHAEVDLGSEFGPKLEKYASCACTEASMSMLVQKMGLRLKNLVNIPALFYHLIQHNHLDAVDVFVTLDEQFAVLNLATLMTAPVPPLTYINQLMVNTHLSPTNLFILINSVLLNLPCPGSSPTVNLLTTNFHESLGSHFKGLGEKSAEDLAKSRCKISIMLDDSVLQLGYCGVVMAQENKEWELMPLKTPELPKDMRLTAELGCSEKYVKPKFSLDGSQLACFDFNSYTIRIWKLSKRCPDALDTRVVRTDFALKVPNFYVLLLQRLGLSVPMDLLGLQNTSVCVSTECVSLHDLLANYSEVFRFSHSELDFDWVLGDRIALKLRSKIIFVYNLG